MTDGTSLDLVLRPGDGPRRVRLGLRRLIPERSYQVTGAIEAAVIADAGGTAVIEVDLGGRHVVRVSPV